LFHEGGFVYFRALEIHNVWTADEARRFLMHVKDEKNAQYAALFALALDSCLRKAELLGLQWQDIDGASLLVERQLLWVNKDEGTGTITLTTSLPKGGHERSKQAEVKMKNRRQYVDHGLMFAQEWEQKSSKNAVLGGPLSRTVIGRQLERLCKASGVKRITPHGSHNTPSLSGCPDTAGTFGMS
jgi:integrase